jgi:hypothetical protein
MGGCGSASATPATANWCCAAQVVAFLKTLTGDQPKFTLPILPPSSDATPRPTPFSK